MTVTDPQHDTVTFDVIVVGAGPPGENAADYAVKGGLTAALVEVELVGGECSYWACMPSKALLRPVEVLDLAHHVPGIGLGDRLDIGPVLASRDGFTHDHDDASQLEWAEGAGITVVRGRGRLAGDKRVDVEAADGTVRKLTARHAVVLATGSCAAVPPIDGLREAKPWTSRDVTNLKTVPDRIVVIGGGVVGCEAATWLVGLGARVTVVSIGERLLEAFEPFAGDLLAERLRANGADVRLAATVERVRRGPVTTVEEGEPRGSEVTVVLDTGEVVVDEVLIAAGRTPSSTGIGLDVVGLEAGTYIETDDQLLVNDVAGEWLYAVGDVTGRNLLTHMGKYQARVCGDVIAARAAGSPTDARRFAATSDHGRVPQVTFTSPQVASVGLTEAEARDAGTAVRTVEYDIGSVAGAALLRDDFSGRAKLVVDTDDQTIVGATFVGPEVAELLHAATVAVVGKVPLDVLWHAVPSYPTVSEIWLRLLETWRAEAS
jgi:pyruvate/2-oxoglutarate dehydrogenase complex dihydrolipoamide dehydrogenase (E3) component